MIQYRSPTIITCDTEEERDLNWGASVAVHTLDTDRWYKIINNTWALVPSQDIQGQYVYSNKVIVKSINDFPAPVSGVITLADNTTYLINGTINIGTNRIVVGIKNTIRGEDRQNDILISSTPDTMFTMDNSIVRKLTLIFDTLTLKATAGTLINATGGSSDQVTFITVTVSSSLTGGTFSGVAFSMRISSLSSAFSINGFTFTGTNTALTFRDSSCSNNAGTLFDLSTSIISVIRMSRNSINISTGQIFFNATSLTLNTAAQIALNLFLGLGSYIIGANSSSIGWKFTNNINTTDTPIPYSAIANTFIEDEIPAGTINGINMNFTLANIPITGSLKVYLNGLKLSKINDYTEIGGILTMINIPYPSDSFLVDYNY